MRLRAEDAEDLAVISACLQDALVPVRDLAFDQDTGAFLLVANRFRWESYDSEAKDAAGFERVLCGVTFDAVDAVAYRGFHRSEEDRILSLLAIRPASGAADGSGDGGGAIELEFSGGATIRLSTAAIACRLHDFGEPWPTAWQPDHPPDVPT
ncbi:MAG TPA: DUF2948 family protein [Stellaceae bacterium]|nr:DUF2948 family protein [Stellaceae bacterium]